VGVPPEANKDFYQASDYRPRSRRVDTPIDLNVKRYEKRPEHCVSQNLKTGNNDANFKEFEDVVYSLKIQFNSMKLTANAPDNQWLEVEGPFRMAYFRGVNRMFQGGYSFLDPQLRYIS